MPVRPSGRVGSARALVLLSVVLMSRLLVCLDNGGAPFFSPMGVKQLTCTRFELLAHGLGVAVAPRTLNPEPSWNVCHIELRPPVPMWELAFVTARHEPLSIEASRDTDDDALRARPIA